MSNPPDHSHFWFAMTRSQQMALLDIIMAYMRSDEPQQFQDCSQPECPITTTPQLLDLIQNARLIKL